ncbi:putative mitochondrial protein [Arachis hypogaea]|nr:putative mitochondrial protein [Arachis hypogaea]
MLFKGISASLYDENPFNSSQKSSSNMDSSITHLLFADYCIIFAKAKEEEVYQIIQVLNRYTEASGQRINLEKLGISFGSLIPIQTKVNIEEILGMAAWENPGKYLGLPTIWGRSKNKALEWIEEKVMNKIEGWKEKLLNQAGKKVLIKSVIQAIPAYTMNVVKFSKNFCRRLSARVAKFWWASSGKESGIHRKSWAKILRSREDGGLGFKDFELQNLAHLAKQAWRILRNPEAIWVRILKAVYFSNNSFWEARVHRGPSWVWRSILEGRDFLRRKGS